MSQKTIISTFFPIPLRFWTIPRERGGGVQPRHHHHRSQLAPSKDSPEHYLGFARGGGWVWAGRFYYLLFWWIDFLRMCSEKPRDPSNLPPGKKRVQTFYRICIRVWESVVGLGWLEAVGLAPAWIYIIYVMNPSQKSGSVRPWRVARVVVAGKTWIRSFRFSQRGKMIFHLFLGFDIPFVLAKWRRRCVCFSSMTKMECKERIIFRGQLGNNNNGETFLWMCRERGFLGGRGWSKVVEYNNKFMNQAKIEKSSTVLLGGSDGAYIF